MLIQFVAYSNNNADFPDHLLSFNAPHKFDAIVTKPWGCLCTFSWNLFIKKTDLQSSLQSQCSRYFMFVIVYLFQSQLVEPEWHVELQKQFFNCWKWKLDTETKGNSHQHWERWGAQKKSAFTGCIRQNENPTDFEIVKEPLLVQKQTLHQQKALDLC